MTLRPHHQVEQIVLNIQFDDAQLAAHEQQDLAEWLQQDLLPAVNGLFTRYAPGAQVLRLQPIQLDCGTLSVDNYRQGIQTQLLDLLTRAIKAQMLPINSEGLTDTAEFTPSHTEFCPLAVGDAEILGTHHRQSLKDSLRATADVLLIFLRTGLLPGYRPHSASPHHADNPLHSGGNGQGDQPSHLLHHQLWEKLLGANSGASTLAGTTESARDQTAAPAPTLIESTRLKRDTASGFAAEHLAHALRQTPQRDVLIKRLLQQFTPHHWQQLLTQLSPSAAAELNALLKNIQQRQARDSTWAPGWEARMGWSELLHLVLSHPSSATAGDLAPTFLAHLANHNPQAAREMLHKWTIPTAAISKEIHSTEISSIDCGSIENSPIDNRSADLERSSLQAAKQALLRCDWGTFARHWQHLYAHQPQEFKHLLTAYLPQDEVRQHLLANGPSNLLRAISECINPTLTESVAVIAAHLAQINHSEFEQPLTESDFRVAENEFRLTESELQLTVIELQLTESDLQQLWALTTHLLLDQAAVDGAPTSAVAAPTPSDQLLRRLCELYAQLCHLPAHLLAQLWQKALGRVFYVGETNAQEIGLSAANGSVSSTDTDDAETHLTQTMSGPSHNLSAPASANDLHSSTDHANSILLSVTSLERDSLTTRQPKLSNLPSLKTRGNNSEQDRAASATPAVPCDTSSQTEVELSDLASGLYQSREPTDSSSKTNLSEHYFVQRTSSAVGRREKNPPTKPLAEEASQLSRRSRNERTGADLRSAAEALLAGDWIRLESQWQQLSAREPAQLTELLRTYLPRAEIRQKLAIHAPLRLMQGIVHFLNSCLGANLQRLQEQMAKISRYAIESRQLWALALNLCCENLPSTSRSTAISTSTSTAESHNDQGEDRVEDLLRRLAQRYAQLNHLCAESLSGQWLRALGLITEPDEFFAEDLSTKNTAADNDIRDGNAADYNAGSTYDAIDVSQFFTRLQSEEVGWTSLPQNVDFMVRLISHCIQKQPDSTAKQRDEFIQAIIQFAPASTCEQIHYYQEVLAALLRQTEIDLEALRASTIASVADTRSPTPAKLTVRDDGMATARVMPPSDLHTSTGDAAHSRSDAVNHSIELEEISPPENSLSPQRLSETWDVQAPDDFIQWCENFHSGQLPWTALPTTPEALAGIVARYLHVHPRFAEPFRAQFQQSINQTAPPATAQRHYYEALFKGLLAQDTIDLEALRAQAVADGGLIQPVELSEPAFDSTATDLAAEQNDVLSANNAPLSADFPAKQDSELRTNPEAISASLVAEYQQKKMASDLDEEFKDCAASITEHTYKNFKNDRDEEGREKHNAHSREQILNSVKSETDHLSPDNHPNHRTLLALLTENLNSPQQNAQALQQQVHALLQQQIPSVREQWQQVLREERFYPYLIARVPAHWLHRVCQTLGGGRYEEVDQLARRALQALLTLRVDITDHALVQAQWRFMLSRTFGAQRDESAEQRLNPLIKHFSQAAKLADPERLLKLLRRQQDQHQQPINASAAAMPISAQSPRATAPLPPDRTPWSTELALNNAGQVLVAPFLPRLFEMFNLTKAGQFVDFQASERAVHLLQFIVNEQTDAPEYELTLNKVLCGIPTAAPISAGIDITQVERDTIHHMLTSIIAHWKILGATSVAGLRNTFLQRQGWLQLGEEGWQLQVQQGPFDMLLDHLPWSIALLKSSWMDQPLHVHWRTN